MEKTLEKRKKYIGLGSDDVPSLGVLEGDILRILWEAGEPQSSVQVYESMYFTRRNQKREMQSPSTIAVTLSRMVEKGLLEVERQPKGGKGYYYPKKSRAEVVSQVMDDVCRRLTGQPLGYLLNELQTQNECKQPEKCAAGSLSEIVARLKKLQAEDHTLLPPASEE